MVKLNYIVEKGEKMRKQNDIILISLVMIIVLLIVLVSISINSILGENEIMQKIKQAQEVIAEQINDEEVQIQTKANNKHELEK